MREILCGALAFLVCSTAFGQVGVKDMIKRQLGGADERNKQVEDAMSEKPKQQQPANPAAQGAIKDGWITRKSKDGKAEVRLYFAHPEKLDKSKPVPALIVLQEWWGVNEDIQERTREFAKHGYYAVAPDLYHGESTDDPKKAAELKGKLTNPVALVDMKTGLDLLEEEVHNQVVDAKRVGAIGWCMGGEQSLLLSLADTRVKATVIFYGPLVTDVEQLKKLQGPVLGVFGDDDKRPSPSDVDKFGAALKEAGKTDVKLLRFQGAGHAFASKAAAKMGAYKEPQAKEAWAKTWEWLDGKLLNKK